MHVSVTGMAADSAVIALSVAISFTVVTVMYTSL